MEYILPQATTYASAYNRLALVMFLNTVWPFFQIVTAPEDGPYDILHEIGEYYSAAYTCFFYFNAYGWTLIGMLLYSKFGWWDSNLMWQILYSARYLGLIFHIISVPMQSLLSISLADDKIYPFLNIVMVFILEKAYTQYGSDAMKYIDSEWSQGNSRYPFAV